MAPALGIPEGSEKIGCFCQVAALHGLCDSADTLYGNITDNFHMAQDKVFLKYAGYAV